jgi:putative ABC transport system substrate-binding protein
VDEEFLMMKRREFIALLGGAAAAWPLSARAQQPDRVRRIGVLNAYSENDREVTRRFAALQQGLAQLGWVEGRNLRFDHRWAAGDAVRMRTYATELVSLNLDLLVASSTPTLAALQQATLKIPIVFVAVSDPVGDGFVASLSRPGGNITGFSNFDPPMAGKWLQLLKQVAPSIVRVTAIFNPDTAPHSLFLPSIKAAAPTFAVELVAAPVRNAAEIESAMAAAAREPGGGLMVVPDASNTVHRAQIVALATQHRVPAMYYQRVFTASGGLMSYGTDLIDQHRLAAGYVDRILKGEKPAELPVQAPTKYELVINLKTAKAFGLTVPSTLLVAADEVIE